MSKKPKNLEEKCDKSYKKPGLHPFSRRHILEKNTGRGFALTSWPPPPPETFKV